MEKIGEGQHVYGLYARSNHSPLREDNSLQRPYNSCDAYLKVTCRVKATQRCSNTIIHAGGHIGLSLSTCGTMSREVFGHNWSIS